jgi:hypothetical protein
MSINIFQFRINGQVHAVSSTRNRVRRNGKAHTVCAIRVTDTAQGLAPNEPDRAAPFTCDSCLNFVVALNDVLDTDFGFNGQRFLPR